MSQLSLFSADAREPMLADVDGLLAGPGQVVRSGATARVSVVVDDRWRVDALLGELGRLGVTGESEPAEPGRVTVRTPWLPQLLGVADAWSRGAVKVPPPGWVLDGPRLRFWCLAAGSGVAQDRSETDGRPVLYTLSLGASDEPTWVPVGAALAAAGIAGVLVGPRADGPGYRIVGQRRLARLRELVGEPPPGVPEEAWPASSPARH
jgi:hypothetical protein